MIPAPKEETKGHAGITDNVEDGSDQTIIVINPYTTHHIAYLCNDKIGQHSLNFSLGKSKECGTNNRDYHQPWHTANPDIRVQMKTRLQIPTEPCESSHKSLPWSPKEPIGRKLWWVHCNMRSAATHEMEECHLNENSNANQYKCNLHGGESTKSLASITSRIPTMLRVPVLM